MAQAAPFNFWRYIGIGTREVYFIAHAVWQPHCHQQKSVRVDGADGNEAGNQNGWKILET